MRVDNTPHSQKAMRWQQPSVRVLSAQGRAAARGPLLSANQLQLSLHIGSNQAAQDGCHARRKVRKAQALKPLHALQRRLPAGRKERTAWLRRNAVSCTARPLSVRHSTNQPVSQQER